MHSLSTLLTLSGTAAAGTLLWDGRFNDLTSSTDLNKWSFSNEVGPYQYYIHGPGNVTEYVNLSSDFKNPADTSSNQGVKITIDNTAYWNGDSMRRTEVIPQTTAAINKGKVAYHFSISRTTANAPGTQEEHQVAFFESHFTELKYGLISGEQGTTSDASLRWDVGGQSQWNTTFDAGVWHNMAYEIDFDAGTVGFWHSTGADDLVQTIAPMTASTSSNGADWHLGVLRLAPSGNGVPADADDGPEDWLFSGVYVESGDVTTSVVGPAGADGSAPVVSSSSVASLAAPTSSSIGASSVSVSIPSSVSSAIAAANTSVIGSNPTLMPTTLLTMTVSPIPSSPMASASEPATATDIPSAPESTPPTSSAVIEPPTSSAPPSTNPAASASAPVSAPLSTGTGQATSGTGTESESESKMLAEIFELLIELIVKYADPQAA